MFMNHTSKHSCAFFVNLKFPNRATTKQTTTKKPYHLKVNKNQDFDNFEFQISLSIKKNVLEKLKLFYSMYILIKDRKLNTTFKIKKMFIQNFEFKHCIRVPNKKINSKKVIES